MADFLNDGSLIGFWPLNEPSGAHIFRNYSPARAFRPSGISFDFHVAVAETQSDAQLKSVWPGTTSVFNPESGVTYHGFQVQGYWKLGSNSSPYSRYLVMGNGCSQAREQTLAPNVAGSGFTAGIWIYPNSNGYLNFYADAVPASFNGETEGIRCHTLMGQFQFNSLGGWHIGVSGSMANGAQFNSDPNNQQLTAYVGIERAGGTPVVIRTPIESGRYTHITMSHSYVNGTLDVLSLYKDGILAASTTNPGNTTLSNATLVGRALTIGGGDNANTIANGYGGTCGWNHLVSGAYVFRRPLSAAEILDLHNGSSLQPLESNRPIYIPVTLEDSSLLAYYPFMSVGFPDVSRNHRPLIGPKDEGPSTANMPIPGPFDCGSVFQNGTNQSAALVATSGLIYDMLNGRSWTISVNAGPITNNGRPNNMIFSMGSVSTQTAGAPTAISNATFGMALTEITSPNRMRLSVYPLGDITASVYNIDTATSGFYVGSSHNYAVSYDDSTRGIAVYLDGHLQGSGILDHSLTDQLIRLAGSGYPLMFANGVSNTISDSSTRGLIAAGGQDLSIGQIMIAGRAMLPEELRYIAESGIDISRTFRTPYDPRMMGYWPCSDYKMDDVVVEDRARVWNMFPGNLARSDTFYKWSSVYLNMMTEQFGTRTVPNSLASYGPLGITSGVFAVQGLSPSIAAATNAANARSSIANLSQRYKPVNEVNSNACQNFIGDFVLGYEVTPSGNIPATPFGLTSDSNKFEFNSTLTLYGNMGSSSSDGELRSFLTTVDADQGSGVSIVFASRQGGFSAANYTSLVSGVLHYGVPNKVLFHTKFDSPYNVAADAAGSTPVSISLWINGNLVQRRRSTAANARVWAVGTPDTNDDLYLLEFGGEISNELISTTISRDGGLGDIYMREIFLMRGRFKKGEIEDLAASGIQHPTIAGFTPTLPKTQVTIVNADLEGYWRFSGDAVSSGITDLSFNNRNLTPLSQQKNDAGASTQSSRSFRFIPGPFKDSDLAVKCSGLTYASASPGATNITPPFAVSGVQFDSPQNGFSVGFFMSKQAVVTAGTANVLLSYGITGSNAVNSTTTDFNRGWSILTDDDENVKMVMSVGGGGYYDNVSNASQSGQIVCGTFNTDNIYDDQTKFNNFVFGHQKTPRLTAWSHYCWTYDPTIKTLICYVNGQEVDRKVTKFAVDPLNGGPASGLNPIVPVNPAARMITMLSHQNASPWDFSGSALIDNTSVFTDLFYFSKALSEPEVRYIALNGIDGAEGTPTSGIIGGYIYGAGQSSGIIGGYNRGLDYMSGIIGGWSFGAFDASGTIGGYISGVIFQTTTSGTLGGYIRGSDIGSGLIGGFIQGSDSVSGILGGFILGGLNSSMQFDGSFVIQGFAAKDFDSQITLRKSVNADFDAKLVIFQAETGPIVDIIVPGSTANVTAPLNQYFIGAASGTQGKSIAQVRWTFGDLTPPVTVAESGVGLYPVQHHYAGSGFFIAKFEAIDSNGIHGSATRIINAASGIDPVIVSLSGVPRSGDAVLTVDFTTTVDILPPGVSVNASLLNFDDGQSTIMFNPTHSYNEPGIYRPVWCIRDSRGVIWCDSLEAGNDFLRGI